MSNSKGAGKPDETKPDKTPLSWWAAAIIIAALASRVLQTNGYDWLALHFPWLVNLISEPIMRFLIQVVSLSVGCWASNKPNVLVVVTIVLAGVTAWVSVPSAFGYWLFGSWGRLLFALAAFVALVACVVSLIKVGEASNATSKSGSDKPTKPHQGDAEENQGDAEEKLPATDVDNRRQAARLVASAVAIALSSPPP